VIKLKDILLEKDDKLDSENPNKILVKNKKSGETYYINKDNFNSAIHEKQKGSEQTAQKSEKEDSKDGKKKDTKAGETEKPKEDDKKEEPKKDNTKQKFLIPSYEADNILKKSSGLRPDLEDKLIKYNYNKLFDEYNKLQMDGADFEKLKGVMKTFQTVALSKFSLLSDKENDPKVIESAIIYRKNEKQINKMLQTQEKLMSKAQLEKELSKKGQPEELMYELKKTQAIYNMDEHFKTPGSKLEKDIVVYRGVDKSIIDKFEKAGKWIDNGFVSTSLNPMITEIEQNKERNPLLKIQLKTGDSVLILSKEEDTNFFETEVTLPRGCTFTIGNYDKVKNSYDVSVEYPNA